MGHLEDGNDPAKAETIGILLVHGIGDQQKFQHLQTAADYLVKALALQYGEDNIAVEMFPGLNGRAPLSIFVDIGPKKICFDLHEMWWRDLGERPKTIALFKFWIWALSLAGTRGYFVPSSANRKQPQNASVRFGAILPHDRLVLFAKTTYLFVLLAPLAVVFQLLSTIPGVKRIALVRTVFTYLSSVQMYQERRASQSGMLTDFDQSRRISIQRRMANTIIDVAERRYDRWYIFAHSLGSVIALKGLMYDGNAFARFMSMTRWNNKGFAFKTQTPPTATDYPDEPKKPMWLDPDDAVDLSQVYSRLRGLVTYGSPLETFARTWPAIVETNATPAFSKDFEWINLHDPADIVGSELRSFGTASPQSRGTCAPKNVRCRASTNVAWAHSSYFATTSRTRDRKILPSLIDWMIQNAPAFDTTNADLQPRLILSAGFCGRRSLAFIQWVLVLVIGCLIWPYSIYVVSQAVRGMATAATFFIDGAAGWIDGWHRSTVDTVGKLIFGNDYLLNLVHAASVVGIVASVLLLLSVVHFFFDLALDKLDRARSLASKNISQPRSAHRPSIPIDPR